MWPRKYTVVFPWEFYRACVFYRPTVSQARTTCLDEAVEFAAKTLGVAKLRDQQIAALRQIVGGHDVFINYLGTGTRLLWRVCTCVKSKLFNNVAHAY